MIERLKRFVSVRSVSRDEASLADAIGDEFAALGLRVQRAGNNVWFEIGDAARPRLLLNSHIDTVPPGEGWSSDPWTPCECDGRLIGLGANDAKGCVVSMIEAALAARQRMDCGHPIGVTMVVDLNSE